MAAEEWRPIPGCPNYEASSLGRVRRKAGTEGCPISRVLRPKTRKARKGRLAYQEVALSHGGEPKSFLLHRLIALAFHGDPPKDKPIAAHCDGDPKNNRPENIRWATQSENLFDRYKHARAKAA